MTPPPGPKLPHIVTSPMLSTTMPSGPLTDSITCGTTCSGSGISAPKIDGGTLLINQAVHIE